MARETFVDLDPPHRVVFTWGWEPRPDGETYDVPPGSSTIEIVLEQEGDGTRLRFAHHDLPTAVSAGKHARGWDHYLARLAVAAAGGDPRWDSWLDGAM